MYPADSAPGYRRILALALPIILANSATPLLALSDTAVIGHVGTTDQLGAIALGGLLFNFLFWGFGFLRMSTSGFVAQARGREDPVELAATVGRGLGLAVLIGLALIALQGPLATLALALFGAGAAVEAGTRAFFDIRIWGAPAALSLYVLTGYFIGRGHTRVLLAVQLVMNGLNILLDVLFAGVLGWGVRGIALGTVLAEWATLGLAAALAWRSLREPVAGLSPAIAAALRDRARLRRLLGANADIMVRTLFLLLGFALFTDRGARLGDTVLAANHLLLQLVSFSAFFLDGFAHVTEALAGRALGAGRRAVFTAVVRRASVLAGATALGLAAAVLWVGEYAIAGLTVLPGVRAEAAAALPWCALYVAVSFAAFQLDGVFIGATRTRALRNAAVISTLVFVGAAALAAHYPASFPRPRPG